MVPSVFHTLETFPLTINGKIDEEALALHSTHPIETALPGLSLNESEVALAEIWREILEVDDIGRSDNFFDLGGHSLLVPRVHRRIKDHFDTEISIVDMFRYTTLAELATHIHGSKSSQVPLALSEDRARLRQARRNSRTHGRRPS
jgi:acyl carrier protein